MYFLFMVSRQAQPCFKTHFALFAATFAVSADSKYHPAFSLLRIFHALGSTRTRQEKFRNW